jgi:hypothetical protein
MESSTCADISDQTVGQGGFAVIDMRDDREVANVAQCTHGVSAILESGSWSGLMERGFRHFRAGLWSGMEAGSRSAGRWESLPQPRKTGSGSPKGADSNVFRLGEKQAGMMPDGDWRFRDGP